MHLQGYLLYLQDRGHAVPFALETLVDCVASGICQRLLYGNGWLWAGLIYHIRCSVLCLALALCGR